MRYDGGSIHKGWFISWSLTPSKEHFFLFGEIKPDCYLVIQVLMEREWIENSCVDQSEICRCLWWHALPLVHIWFFCLWHLWPLWVQPVSLWNMPYKCQNAKRCLHSVIMKDKNTECKRIATALLKKWQIYICILLWVCILGDPNTAFIGTIQKHNLKYRQQDKTQASNPNKQQARELWQNGNHSSWWS